MTEKTHKNYGIEALRIVSMFFIVVHHVLGHGGALREWGAAHISNTLLETIVICAVDCYAIISGYVGYREEEIHTRKRIEKYVLMWLQAVFYSFGIALLFYLVKPSSESMSKVLAGIFPVSSQQYWYFTAYTGVYVLMPLLNNFFTQISTKKSNRVMASVTFVFSGYATIVVLMLKKDIFVLQSGYSFVWLALLYVVGAWIKKCNIFQKVKGRYLVLGLIFSVGITWAVYILTTGKVSLMSYISPTIVFNAFALVCIFAKGSNIFEKSKMIYFWAPTTFGVYLGHDNAIVRKYIISGRFAWIANQSVLTAPLYTVLVALIIFAIFSLVEKVRIEVFKLLKIEWIISKIYYAINAQIRKGVRNDT